MKRLTFVLILMAALAALPALGQYAFQFEVPDQGAVSDLVQLHSFHNLVINTGSTSDTYTVSIVKQMPGDWVGSLCEGVLCYPPFVTDITFTLAPGDTTELLMDITPLTNTGTGTSTLTLSSQGNPALSETRVFSVVTPGLDALVVDASGGMGYGSYYTSALGGLGLSSGLWEADKSGALDASELASFGTVIWAAGSNPDAFTATDLSNLQTYLEAGGDAILSGQDLARHFCSATGAQYSPDAKARFNSVLGVTWLADDTADDTLDGLSGDPVAAGMSFSLAGGTGAGANTSPDRILDTGAGAPSIQYSAGYIAAVRSSWNLGRSYFMGFGFENISTDADRQALMGNILTWLQGSVSATPGLVPSVFASAPVAAPNPFNPRTRIHFTVGGSQSVAGDVTVYDVMGRRVRDLFQGHFQVGPVNLAWDGRDDRGAIVSGGLYLVRLKLADETRSLKIVLAK